VTELARTPSVNLRVIGSWNWEYVWVLGVAELGVFYAVSITGPSAVTASVCS
jgi:hypothetical protein